MIERLFVILGAGASYDCVPRDAPSDARYQPPLTSDLFKAQREGYAPILAKYPLAKAAAAELATVQSATSLETELRERYRDSEHAHDRRIFRGVLPYLQELLYTISYEYTPFPQNYEVLVTKLLRLSEVIFVSLNYDLFLDNALLAVSPDKSGMGWYMRDGQKWSLIKLHGSVDWSREMIVDRLARPTDFTEPKTETDLAKDILLRPTRKLDGIRGIEPNAVPSRPYYPALAAPVGQADELVCPPEHVEYLKQRLSETQPIHLLVIGYSGLDQEVVSLIHESERGVKTLTIVDRGEEATRAVAERLAQQGVRAQDTKFEAGGFNGWVRKGGLDAFVKHMSNEPF